jgi:hypothetical protein
MDDSEISRRLSSCFTVQVALDAAIEFRVTTDDGKNCSPEAMLTIRRLMLEGMAIMCLLQENLGCLPDHFNNMLLVGQVKAERARLGGMPKEKRP